VALRETNKGTAVFEQVQGGRNLGEPGGEDGPIARLLSP